MLGEGHLKMDLRKNLRRSRYLDLPYLCFILIVNGKAYS